MKRLQRFQISLIYFLSFLFVSSSGDHVHGATATAGTQRPDAEKIILAHKLVAQGDVPAARKILESAIGALVDQNKDRERRGLLHLAHAVIDYQSGQANSSSDANSDASAERHFQQAIESGISVSDYAHFHLGKLKSKTNHIKEARLEFERVISARPSKATENDARYQIFQIELQEKRWRPALTQLEFLRKALRGDERYAEIIYNLAFVEKKLGHHGVSCKWARELYAKYPAYQRIDSWGPHLNTNSIEGEKTGCSSTNKDLKTRVRRLWLSGEDLRAAAELKLLKDETDDEGNSLVDNLTINHLIGDGHLDEAMKLLLQRYDQERNRPPYLLLLAKAAAGAGDFQVAVSAYQRAYDLAPRGKNGLNSLFQAAFTSYQMQDYDGASRKFDQLLKVNRNSKLGREAQWYLAWIRYLRGDYHGAYENFSSFAKNSPQKSKRRRRRSSESSVPSDSVAQDRMKYWSAVCLLKMGKKDEAIPLFQTLARDPSLGYYAILSFYRLTEITGAQIPPTVETYFGLRRAEAPTGKATNLEAKEIAEAVVEAAEVATVEYQEETTKSVKTAGLSPALTDSENGIGGEGSQGNDGHGEADEKENPDSLEAIDPERPTDLAPVSPTFRDSGLALKFERVRDLVIVGLEDEARRELREIEKRAHSVADRRILMAELANVKNFERSSYIAEVGFGSARLAGGIKGDGRVFWEHAYPRAWDSAVDRAAKSTSVPEELIWGIMRAESHFRYDARSPVGAMGLMQLMPFTARKVADLLKLKAFEIRTLGEPEVNIKIGSRYLQRLVEKFSAKIPLVAAAYNAGPHRVHAWVRNFGSLEMDEFIEHIPYVETRNYVKRVARNVQIYSLLYKSNSSKKAMSWIIQPVGIQLTEAYPQKEIW